MIFKPELVEKILAGEKTMTRRPVKGDAPYRYQAGTDYAVQPGRGKPAVARIRVTNVRREELSWISQEDAKAEGFASVQEFFEYWVQLYGEIDFAMKVWVVSFELMEVLDAV